MDRFFNIKPKLCIVLDIDETILQYIDSSPMEEKYKTFNNITVVTPYKSPIPNPKIIFRPGIEEFFRFVYNNKFNINIHLGIWTFGDRKHADYTANKWIPFLINNLNQKRDANSKIPIVKFDFVYCDKDYIEWKNNHIDADNKDLRMIYQNNPQWTRENTIIIDNMVSYINHIHNKKNGILIQPFEPNSPNPRAYEDAISDNVFVESIIPICEKLLARPNTQSVTDVLEPYKYKISDGIELFVAGNKIQDDNGKYIYIKRGGRAKKEGKKTKK